MAMNGQVELLNTTPIPGRYFLADYGLLKVQGMSCNECATCVCNNLMLLDGVYSVEVHPHKEMVEVYFDGRRVTAQQLIDGLPRSSRDGRYLFNAQFLAHEVHAYFKG
jgi:copper chaperone CopZ